MNAALVTSRYNFHVPVEGGALLYNASSGSVLRFGGRDGVQVAAALSGPVARFSAGVLPDAVIADLQAGAFLVNEGIDEVSEIRRRFQRARAETPMVLTITTTMDCNLGCYYCYEERSTKRLGQSDLRAISKLARQRLEASGKKQLHVDWYGGEPLLNLDFLEPASLALQALCAELGVTYVSSVISNGTCWPDDVGAFVKRHCIRQVQISFDGLRRNHDKRRRYRSKFKPAGDVSSFDQAFVLVDRLLDHCRVDVRFNIDRGNAEDVLPFVDLVRKRGWFERPFPAVIQPARLASFSARSSFMRKSELTMEQYDEIRRQVREAMAGVGCVEESEVPDGDPLPRTSVCAALAGASIIVGADGLTYRCGLQVGETQRAVGHVEHDGLPVQVLRRGDSIGLPVLNDQGADASWWEAFDPTSLETCSQCSFLPICWGGCPKRHLERDQHALDEQSIYWLKNLPRLVAQVAGTVASDPELEFTVADQFR